MKKLLAILVLGLFLIPPSWADNIRDLQIEGISIGDSLLDHFSEEVIKKNNGIILKNSFAMNVPTEPSWASFFMLDQEPFDHQHNRFNGEKDTLLFNLFRSNGYSILTGYSGSYLGVEKGDRVNFKYLRNGQIKETYWIVE